MDNTPQLRAARYCVGHDEYRPVYHHPFHQEGWNLATDGRVLFGWKGEPVTTGHEKAPQAVALLTSEEYPLPTPFVLYLATLNAALDRIPKVPGMCPSCDGRKRYECQCCADQHACGHCMGSGHDPNGKAVNTDPTAKVQLKGLAHFVAEKLLQLQAVMRALGVDTITITHGSASKGSRCTFPNGELLLIMPDMIHDGDEVTATITNGQAAPTIQP